MPRRRTPANEQGRAATERWRTRQRSMRRPEIDAVDSAIAAAVSVFRHKAEASGVSRNLERATALEEMAINYLVSSGADADYARQKVLSRTHRLDSEALARLVFKAN